MVRSVFVSLFCVYSAFADNPALLSLTMPGKSIVMPPKFLQAEVPFFSKIRNEADSLYAVINSGSGVEVVCVDLAASKVKWRHTIRGVLNVMRLDCAKSGQVLIAGMDKAYILDSVGGHELNHIGAHGWPVCVPRNDSVVYYDPERQELTSYQFDGSLLWRRTLESEEPVFAIYHMQGGLILLDVQPIRRRADSKHDLVCLQATSGDVKWKYQLDDAKNGDISDVHTASSKSFVALLYGKNIFLIDAATGAFTSRTILPFVASFISFLDNNILLVVRSDGIHEVEVYDVRTMKRIQEHYVSRLVDIPSMILDGQAIVGDKIIDVTSGEVRSITGGFEMRAFDDNTTENYVQGLLYFAPSDVSNGFRKVDVLDVKTGAVKTVYKEVIEGIEISTNDK